MPGFGATIAIIDNDRILLTKREDFEVWCLPGGLTDNGESLAQTAVREAYEETGLEVRLTRLVGVYSRVGGYTDLHGALFAAERVSGDLRPQVSEVIDIEWFSRDAIPEELFWWHRQQIIDALDGVGGGVATVATLHPGLTLPPGEHIYAARDASGLSRFDFYHRYFESNPQNNVRRDLG